jgi:4-hydroxy-tetrahydrodipicolinate synthase
VVRFFGQVADQIDVPVAVQNNPVNLAVSLSPQSLITLNRQHPNVQLLKGEGFSVDIARVIEGTQGAMDVFGGHGGIELMALLRSGGRGLIPAPDCLKIQVKIWQLWEQNTPASLAEMERLHREVLPLIVFMTRGIPSLLAYGKRLFAERIGIPLGGMREPGLAVTPFGESEVQRFIADLARVEATL